MYSQYSYRDSLYNFEVFYFHKPPKLSSIFGCSVFPMVSSSFSLKSTNSLSPVAGLIEQFEIISIIKKKRNGIYDFVFHCKSGIFNILYIR